MGVLLKNKNIILSIFNESSKNYEHKLQMDH